MALSLTGPEFCLQNSFFLTGLLVWSLPVHLGPCCLHAAAKTSSSNSETPHFAHPCETILSQYYRSLIVGNKLYNARNYRLACKC